MAAAGGGGAGSHSSSSSGHSWPWPASACPSHPLRGQKRDESEAKDWGIPGVSGQEPPSSPLTQDRPPSPTLPKEPGLWAVPPATTSPARQPSQKQRHPGRGVLPRAQGTFWKSTMWCPCTGHRVEPSASSWGGTHSKGPSKGEGAEAGYVFFSYIWVFPISMPNAHSL